MKTVNSFKCSYCGKLYETKDSCRSHEYKCYFNPKTKSCASCAFLKFDNYKYKPHHSIAVRTCMHNMDITRKMKTRCESHYPKAELGSKLKIKEIEPNYNPLLFVRVYLESLKEKIEGDLSVSNDDDFNDLYLDIEYCSLLADAHIAILAKGVSLKIQLYQEANLTTKTNLVHDDDLNNHINFYLEEIDSVIRLCEITGLDKNLMNELIEKTAKELQDIIYLPHLLYKQAELEYNLIMLEKEQQYGNEDSAYYFEQKAKQMQNFGSIAGLFKQHFDMKLPEDAVDSLPTMFYEWCLKRFLEIIPDLKKQIIEKIEVKTKSAVSQDYLQDNSDVPF
jgi:hypothetical protein